MSDSLEQLKDFVNERSLSKPDHFRLRLCFDIQVYVHGALTEHRDGILNFYNRSMEVIGEDVTNFLVDASGRFAKRKPDTLEMLPFWLDGEEEGFYDLILECDAKTDSRSEKSFRLQMVEEEMGFLRLTLPPEFPMEDPKAARELVRELVGDLDFLSGFAGLGVNMHLDYNSHLEDQRVFGISRRFSGVDLGGPNEWARYLAAHVKSVNWMTLLGSPMLEKLGSDLQVRAEATGLLQVDQLTNGIAITAGERPLIGDVNGQEPMDAYEAVTALVKEALVEDMRKWNGVGGYENTRSWLKRFN